MQTRSSFSVYIDTPLSTATSTSTGSSSESATSPSRAPPSPVSLANKENVNPLTGERVVYKTDCKKRKTVLALKSVALPEEVQPLLKKRKGVVPILGSSSSASSSAATARTKKGRRVKKSGRKTSPMPKVDEEPEPSQAAIDSRCYELTVSPLADVTDAYLHTVDAFATVSEDKFVRDTSTEPQLRDYFSPSPDRALRKSASREPSQEPRVFTTPERKEIYSAFTFTSPSTSSERYKNAQKERSVSAPNLILSL